MDIPIVKRIASALAAFGFAIVALFCMVPIANAATPLDAAVANVQHGNVLYVDPTSAGALHWSKEQTDTLTAKLKGSGNPVYVTALPKPSNATANPATTLATALAQQSGKSAVFVVMATGNGGTALDAHSATSAVPQNATTQALSDAKTSDLYNTVLNLVGKLKAYQAPATRAGGNTTVRTTTTAASQPKSYAWVWWTLGIIGGIVLLVVLAVVLVNSRKRKQREAAEAAKAQRAFNNRKRELEGDLANLQSKLLGHNDLLGSDAYSTASRALENANTCLLGATDMSDLGEASKYLSRAQNAMDHNGNAATTGNIAEVRIRPDSVWTPPPAQPAPAATSMQQPAAQQPRQQTDNGGNVYPQPQYQPPRRPQPPSQQQRPVRMQQPPRRPQQMYAGPNNWNPGISPMAYGPTCYPGNYLGYYPMGWGYYDYYGMFIPVDPIGWGLSGLIATELMIDIAEDFAWGGWHHSHWPGDYYDRGDVIIINEHDTVVVDNTGSVDFDQSRIESDVNFTNTGGDDVVDPYGDTTNTESDVNFGDDSQNVQSDQGDNVWDGGGDQQSYETEGFVTTPDELQYDSGPNDQQGFGQQDDTNYDLPIQDDNPGGGWDGGGGDTFGGDQGVGDFGGGDDNNNW